MIARTKSARALSCDALWLRCGWLASVFGGIVILRSFAPSQLSAWIPFHTSCGAITGLPCLFCGTTRAMHHLLNGNFSAALYYNWLAFPILALALTLSAVFLAELIAGKKLLVIERRIRVSPRTLGFGFAIMLSLWSLQVYLAVSQHKSELLNPSGLLYAFFVK
jgi:hypothetical protein